MSTVQIQGITLDDVQRILQRTADHLLRGKMGSGILLMDVNYLYSFDVADMDTVSKLCKLNRLDVKYVKQWHNYLERWYNDQTVPLAFKPQRILRSIDRVVNEGLECVAMCIVGEELFEFKFHAIGEGEDIGSATASDTDLVDEISRIDVTKVNEGGSFSRSGSTIYIVGNHPATLSSAEVTETGVFSTASKTSDLMLDHSIFDPGIGHDQFENAIGSTTVIYMCGI